MIIPDLDMTNRTKSFMHVACKYPGIKSMTYVGERKNHHPYWWLELCKINGWDWRIIEVFKPNAEMLRSQMNADRVINANILDFDDYPEMDLLCFWHGPEHIEKDVFIDNLERIESKAKRLVIFGMPLGELAQGVCYGNTWEQHVSVWQPEDWTALGYKTQSLSGSPGLGHITAWKEIVDG